MVRYEPGRVDVVIDDSRASILIGTVMLHSPLVGRGIAIVTIASGIASVFAPFLIIAGVPEAVGFIGLALGAVWQFAGLGVPPRSGRP